MQLKHKILTLNSIPQNLVTRETVHSLNTFTVQNIMDDGFAYLGGENVSTTNFGFKLYPGQTFIAELSWSDNIYAVGDEGVQIAILELDRR
jgi:hypothetical protein